MNEEETLSSLQHALTRQAEQIAAVAKQLVLDAYAAKARPRPQVSRSRSCSGSSKHVTARWLN